MIRKTRDLEVAESRGYLHRDLQRKVLIGAIIGSVVLAVVLIPLLTNPELRLDVFRQAGFVVSNEGELVADGDSGASLIVLPTQHSVESSDRTQYRYLAAFVAWPTDGHLRLEALNDDAEMALPIESLEFVSASPDGSEMYVRGTDRAAVVDVRAVAVIEDLPADAEPDVDWDWRTATWQHSASICDRISNTATWIGCFRRPVLASYLAGDWHLELQRYGNPDEAHDVMRGLGFRPAIGFTLDDTWLYIQNERGIRRFEVAEVTGG
jgi:hypothetical protein